MSNSTINNLRNATTWRAWLDAMAAAVEECRVTRSSAYMGYDPAAAQALGEAIEAQPSHELVRAHCGVQTGERDWGRLCLAVDPPTAAERQVLARLRPGPHGGLSS